MKSVPMRALCPIYFSLSFLGMESPLIVIDKLKHIGHIVPRPLLKLRQFVSWEGGLAPPKFHRHSILNLNFNICIICRFSSIQILVQAILSRLVLEAPHNEE